MWIHCRYYENHQRDASFVLKIELGLHGMKRIPRSYTPMHALIYWTFSFVIAPTRAQ